MVRQKLVPLAIFLAVVTPVLLIATFSLIKSHRDLTDAVLARRQTIAYLASMTLDEKLNRVKDLAVSLATRVKFGQLIGEGRWIEASQILKRIPDEFPFVDRMIITDPSGTLMADIPEVKAVRERNFAFRDWYRGVSARWEPYVSEAYKRTAEPRYNVVAVAAPIKADSGRVLGVLVSQIRVDMLFSWSQGIEVEQSASIYFVDHHGHLAAHPNYTPQTEILDVSGLPIVQKLIRGQRGVEISADPIGREEMLAAYAPVTGYGWGVIAQQPASMAFAVHNNTLRYLSTVYCFVLLVNGMLAVIIVRNIAALRRANEATQAFNAQLQRANKELEAFAYSVSHDLRAPLRAIDGFSQVLLKDCGERLGDSGRDALGRIRAGASRMSRLIDDLLKLSRVTWAELQRTRVDLSEMARGVASELVRREPGRHVETWIADGVAVEGDPALLRLVLENLLGNSFKFTSKTGEARVEFGVERQDGGPVYYVRDNGAGFDAAYADKLFGAFQRLHSEAEFPGTGIGLATVQRIVHRHGGRVWAEGEVDRGATFYFTLEKE